MGKNPRLTTLAISRNGDHKNVIAKIKCHRRIDFNKMEQRDYKTLLFFWQKSILDCLLSLRKIEEL